MKGSSMTTILKMTESDRGRGLTKRIAGIAAVLLLSAFSSTAMAQGDVRYSWFEVSYVGQDVDRMGTRVDLINQQVVDIHGKDGDGIRFRGSVGTWNNFYAFVDFSSSDIDLTGTVTNPGGVFPAEDEFDFTAIRGGIGYKYSLTNKMDLYGELSFDSVDLDFGSLAGESFDTDAQDIGGALGIRTMLGDNLELRAFGRYTSVGDVDLNGPAGIFDTDTLFGVGFGFTIIRGLSITGDYESGEFSNWNVGFRLDLDED
jgi:hypothetical protein